ncbi:MAG: aminopeptidase P family protein [Deltaproteobacteria bacterium]|nr:aminopeptidase P family protein [Candidatus Zymogenaceae bacterium]
MRLERFNGLPTSEIMVRVQKASEAARAAGLSGLLILQHVDIYYFTGTAQRGALFIPADQTGGPGVLCVINDLRRAAAESKFPTIRPLARLRDLPEALAREGFDNPASIGLEMDVLPAKNYLSLSKLFPDTTFHDASGLIRKIRAVKSPLEKKLINRAARQLVSLFRAVPSFFFPNAREIDIAIAAEAHLRGIGHQGTIRLRAFCQELFYGVVVSGPSGAVGSSLDGPVSGMGISPAFPQGASPKIIGDGEPILVDMVGAWGGYLADGARLYYRKELPSKARYAYDASLEIEREVIKLAQPGARAGDLFAAAERIADGHGLLDNFMGIADGRLSYIGHGIGLEVDESPVIARGSTEQLVEGHVFALEPKFIFKDIGAVGIENTFFVGPAGPELLTDAPPEPVKVG